MRSSLLLGLHFIEAMSYLGLPSACRNDFIYMVPPFLAYNGALYGNYTMLWEAYNQCRLYRDYLRDGSAGGLWKHVLLGSWDDRGHWSTGHGWAAAGMLRVYGTIKNSGYSSSMRAELNDLESWVSEIHEAIYPYMVSYLLFFVCHLPGELMCLYQTARRRYVP